MKYIIYTPAENIPEEMEYIAQLLDYGADFLYIRKPELDDYALVDYMETIPEKYYPKIITTSLIITKEFDLAGYHFTRDVLQKNKLYQEKVVAWLSEKNKISSVSAHNLQEITTYAQTFNHVLVSPVLPSISKHNHAMDWDMERLKKTVEENNIRASLFAVGGVCPEKMDILQSLGFHNFGLLGTLWKNPQNALHTFKQIVDR